MTKHEGRGLCRCLRLPGARSFGHSRSLSPPGGRPRPLPTRKPRFSHPGPPLGFRPPRSHLHLSASGSPELPATSSLPWEVTFCTLSSACGLPHAGAPTQTVPLPVPGPPLCPLGSSEPRLLLATGPRAASSPAAARPLAGPRPSVLLAPVLPSSPTPLSCLCPLSAPSRPFCAAESDGKVRL